MNLTQFLLLALERNMINNKNRLEIFYTAFQEAAAGEEVLTNSKFYYAIILLSEAMFSQVEGNPFETMFA